MLINCTNHPHDVWDERQKQAAAVYGEVVDFPFPAVDAQLTAQQLAALAQSLGEQLLALGPDAVLCQGEMGLTYGLVSWLLRRGVPVLHACSERVVTQQLLEDGTTQRISRFTFRAFRAYGAADDAEKTPRKQMNV